MLGFTQAVLAHAAAGFFPSGERQLPLPEGEGWGEGERRFTGHKTVRACHPLNEYLMKYKSVTAFASIQRAAAALAFLLLVSASFAGVQITIGHNVGDLETPDFAFTNVPPPSRNDAATAAKFTILSGEPEGSADSLAKLHDGQLPTEADEPGENFFFAAGDNGGRVQLDLGRAVEIKQVNTYSWHPSTRGPQVYKLYAGIETSGQFNATPAKDADLEKCGWKLLASVDTRNQSSGNGGQYGVSLSDPDGIIGKYRYLLFDIAPTETDDAFGNTFYSEMDVVELNAPVTPIAPARVAPLVVHSSDGYAEIVIDTARAPELKDWAAQKLAPALVEWYPKIVAMLPSDGFSAPKKFNVSFRPGNGVAFTSGTRIVVNSTWLDGELHREAVGSVIHETVHVVQQYGHGWRDGSSAPGWLTEGIPDYIRFFKFEPQTHGADLVWLQGRKQMKLNYDGMYRISANFLDYVVEHYDSDKNLIQKVNAACRQGTYTDDLWKQLTGKTLAELNEEWKSAVHQQLTTQGRSGAASPITNNQ
jgi:hypothetical protein